MGYKLDPAKSLLIVLEFLRGFVINAGNSTHTD
jgi:hypothetical protein